MAHSAATTQRKADRRTFAVYWHCVYWEIRTNGHDVNSGLHCELVFHEKSTVYSDLHSRFGLARRLL